MMGRPTVLIQATWSGHLEVMWYLVECGTDKGAKAKNGETALIRAAGMGHLALVMFLVDVSAGMKPPCLVPQDTAQNRDPKFISRFWTSLAKVMGVQLNMTMSYRAQADGQTERQNLIVEDSLSWC
jgi:hypothetical protein